MGSVSVYRDIKGVSTLDLIVDELGGANADVLRDRIVAHAISSTEPHDCGSSIFWAAVRDDNDPAEVFALCVLFLRRNETDYKHGEFWYKDMTEHVGPAYFDVPDVVWDALTPLDPAGETEHEYRYEWRRGVEAHRALGIAKRRPKIGETIEFLHATFGSIATQRFVFDGKSLFRPVYDGCEPSARRVRLRGWTTTPYRIVEKETVDA
jgi:hypothetical protein